MSGPQRSGADPAEEPTGQAREGRASQRPPAERPSTSEPGGPGVDPALEGRTLQQATGGRTGMGEPEEPGASGAGVRARPASGGAGRPRDGRVRRGTVVNLLIVLAVVALAVAPLAMGAGDGKEEPFTGADAQAETAITENDPGYEPWFSPLYEPPSGEIESALFALQAALGAGVLGYYFGMVRTRRKLAAEAASARPDDA